MTRREITREERDRLMERAPYNFVSSNIKIAEGSRQIARSYLKAMRDRIGPITDRRHYRRYMLQWLADAEYRTWEARRLGWRLP